MVNADNPAAPAVSFVLPPSANAGSDWGTDAEFDLSPVAVTAALLVLLSLAQCIAWGPRPQMLLHSTTAGHTCLRVLPWRQPLVPRILGVYGRMTAREPHRALILGGVLALFACGGLMPWAAAQHDAASVFEPWAYLDVATSPVARRAWHTQAALGPRPTTLSVLVSPCNTSRSVLEGAVLPPLISLNNAIVDSGGASDYERICNVRHGADGATRCSAESILSILNPSSVDAASHIDGTSRLWTPAAPTAPAMTSAASHMSPYEVRVRELLRPALLARAASARGMTPSPPRCLRTISSLPPSLSVGRPAAAAPRRLGARRPCASDRTDVA